MTSLFVFLHKTSHTLNFLGQQTFVQPLRRHFDFQYKLFNQVSFDKGTVMFVDVINILTVFNFGIGCQHL